MQATAQTLALNLSQDAAAQSGPRELHVDELALVGGGLPRGGWLGASTAAPEASNVGAEQLPRGGWAA